MRRKRYLVDSDEWLDHYKYPTIGDMQADYKLPQTDQLDAQTRQAMTVPRCGNAFRRNAQPSSVKLQTNRPKVFFQDFIKTDFTQDTFVTAVLTGMNYWSVVCDILFQRTSKIEEANIVVKTELIDGPGETLAYAYFPSGNRLQLPLVFGEEEAWNKPWGISLESTACHEGGHNMGVDHDPTSQGVMAAFYNPKILVPTSSWELKQVVDRYGNPLPKPSDPLPIPAEVDETISILVTGRNLRVKGYEKVTK